MKFFAYVAAENPKAAARVRQSIFGTIDLAATRPYIGTRNARAAELRSLLVRRYPYRVHYLLRGRNVWILHIRHAARSPWEGSR